LGQGHTNHVYTPQVVPLGGEDVVSLASGNEHNCALLNNGQVKCWGEGSFGRLGYGNTEDLGDGPDEMGDALPVLNFGQSVVTLVSGGRNNCVMLLDNSLKCWGDNYWGQLGQESVENFGDDEDEILNMPAIDLGTGRYAVTVDISYDHGCAILDNGTVKCWGFGDNGQLGFGDLENLCGIENDMFHHRCGNAEGEMGDNLPALDFGFVWAQMN
jgi:alpha-tubulin suppressor-like RCC1 family protein